MQLTETMYTLRPHAHVLGPFYMQKKARIWIRAARNKKREVIYSASG
jgi:hypothetical protein|nr:MAG TPA: hypothetical protein [Caudoviricetes sp.]